MFLMIPLIALMVPAILLSLNLMIAAPTDVTYRDMAYKKALSAYYQSGIVPSSVNVMGAEVSTGVVDPTELNYQYLDNLTWKKINAEQAILTACNQILNKCNTTDITKLFAFLPSGKGTVSSLLTMGPAKGSINCSIPSDYQAYGLYILQRSLTDQDTSQSVAGVNYTLYYNKPSSGSGCFFVDIVNAQ